MTLLLRRFEVDVGVVELREVAAVLGVLDFEVVVVVVVLDDGGRGIAVITLIGFFVLVLVFVLL